MGHVVTDKLLTQSAIYFITLLLTNLAGLITFPIWTRVFTIEEYGQLSIIAITIPLAVSISKFGINHSALRLQPVYTEKVNNNSSRKFYSTIVLSSLLFGFLGSIGIFFIWNYILVHSSTNFMLLLSAIVLLSGFRETITLFFTAEQKFM